MRSVRTISASPHDDNALPPVDGFAAPDPSLLGVVISHGHWDHWGLLARAHAGLPVYMGAATQSILNASAFFIRDVPPIAAAGHLVDGQSLQIGPFTITPRLVDHSAFDAYALTVAAGGRRLFYSGDLRGHGRKGSLFEKLVSRPPGGIDVMLMEGSSLGRLDADARFPTEAEIEAELTEIIRRTPGMVLATAGDDEVRRFEVINGAMGR